LHSINTHIMDLAANIKKLREDKGLLQKQVAQEIGLKPAHYNKIEKGLVEPSIKVLDKLAQLFGITIDQIVHLEKGIPEEVTIEDKTAAEQLRLIHHLSDKDRSIIMNIIDMMLTKQKFQDFFQENLPNSQ
jgi:transcriptional regulator with XRE-family HTH domain